MMPAFLGVGDEIITIVFGIGIGVVELVPIGVLKASTANRIESHSNIKGTPLKVDVAVSLIFISVFIFEAVVH